ncbi:hypothetical protein B0O80DRAFT_472927 [Mortierella sp. GBAus27b]|nr:hypothetical protein BGX31_004147 [Mortierella sp. GBA43]KAI8345529.1 hypothetical protein B0O80DRAFT_472927 [Mortierella sp. GBAus27b]
MAIADLLILPAIREALAPSLTTHDRQQCVQVCRAWHTWFAPFLWRSITIDACSPSLPSTESLLRYRHSIECLAYHGRVPEDHLSIHYPALKKLHILSTQPDPLASDHGFGIVEQHPTLTHVKLQSTEHNPFWVLPAGLPDLTTLSLSGIVVLSEDMDKMREMLSQLETLQLHHSLLLRYTTSLQGGWRMRELTLESVSGMAPAEQLEMVRQCSHLRRLSWGLLANHPFPIEEFAQALIANGWPELEDLQLLRSGASDQQLSLIISGMHRIVSLSIAYTELSVLARTALRPHFRWIRELDILMVFVNNEEFIFQVMKSCPRLERLRASTVQAHLMKDDAPWACEGSLKVLEVCFAVSFTERAEQQRILLDRLARFRKLERLDLSSWQGSELSLEFSLEKGLTALAALRRLKELSFERTVQEMTMEDIEWMISRWKNLKVVQGILRIGDRGESERMITRFREADVEVKDWMGH